MTSSRHSAATPRGRHPHAYSSRPHHTDRDITDGLAPTTLEILQKPSEAEGDAAEIKDLQYLGSYSWLDSAEPTIIVPGSPREWRDRETPYAVVPDEGVHIRDPDGHRMPGARYLPLLRAADIVAEENGDHVDWSSVDFVTDRNGLRKLLRWINLGPTSTNLDEFRIDTQLAGARTVLLNRWEKRTVGRLSGGCGYSFKHESTRPAQGCAQNAIASHHRIVKYDFGGFVLVVTFEVDACLPPQRTMPAPAPTVSNDVDGLADRLSTLDLPAGAHSSDHSTEPALKVVRAGSHVPQDAIIELTTASKIKWREAYPQLFVTQTRNYFSAVHKANEVVRVQKRWLGDPEMSQVAENSQAAFKKLRKALQEIRELVVRHGERGRISLVCRSNGEMQVFERTSEANLLPESVLERFAA